VVTETERKTVYEPYQTFYSSQQREMSARVQHLQRTVRKRAQDHSPALAQLATLDSALGDVLLARTRTFYASIPRLLSKRFTQHCENCQASNIEATAWQAVDGGFDQFSREMQGVLLAELEVRLQPVVGLVKAFNEQKKGTECK
jgi:hypothetical protein